MRKRVSVVKALVFGNKNISITPADIFNFGISGIPLLSIMFVNMICIFLDHQVNMAQCTFRQDMPESLPMEIPQNNC